ncbi:glycosyltransferase EpsH [Liquorilactobacillus sucicola DSM 21376 = JCM 15457]|uniref:Glycosyltransferase EpsH n=2 Tax=Liquorilactobacillus sucicola TaxID=519050 RepID=A0A0R2DQF6_9LACO|nr:glycosyltransferase EpsH [Liquorilactobacillus sucicola DSM 21376 = JCM 15457]
MPIYNVEDCLERTIALTATQICNKNDVELILVDDGSEDRSPEICDRYSAHYVNVKTLHQKNAGTGAARNAGIKNARGEYLYFADPDDYLADDTVAAILKMITKQAELFIFNYWNVDSLTGKKERKFLGVNALLNKADFRSDFVKLFKTEMLYTVWNKVYQKKFLLEHRLLFGNAPMGQDVRFNLAVYEKVDSVYLSTECLYYYVQDRIGSSTTKYRSNRFQLKSEEVHLLQKLLTEFGLEAPDFIELLYRNVFLDVSRHIVDCNLSNKEKVKELQRLCSSELFAHLEKTEFKPSISWLLLYKGWYDCLIWYVKSRLYLQNRLAVLTTHKHITSASD